ncbi:hypothetical protein CARUB_v10015694mg [Capsella rubella]|uniref:Knottin scorpion toxin-like domain-containing protein n=1 Tax=Capsella rubella TaxID=81985 RepID=R0I3A5_9BRAS|nr:hypothetical protein CARUB_v10015694mg [Capsella rubella]
MGISKKMLIAFVLTILLAISSVHCSNRISGFGMKQASIYGTCYYLEECHSPSFDDGACQMFCQTKNLTLLGLCNIRTGQCCCKAHTK